MTSGTRRRAAYPAEIHQDRSGEDATELSKRDNSSLPRKSAEEPEACPDVPGRGRVVAPTNFPQSLQLCPPAGNRLNPLHGGVTDTSLFPVSVPAPPEGTVRAGPADGGLAQLENGCMACKR